MNDRLIKAVLAIVPDLYYTALSRLYRFGAAIVVNDLRISSAVENYSPEGPYITMYREIPRGYHRQFRKRSFDQTGVPQNKYKGVDIYNPVSIIQYGLEEYGYYISTKEQHHLEHAKAACSWLIKNQDPLSGKWPYNFDYPHEPSGCLLCSGWASAMAQGEAISLLTRVYRATQDETLMRAAESALIPLTIQVSDGGLCTEYNGNTFFEEYPTEYPSLTLNGFMFCLFGLYDLFKLNGNHTAQTLFNSGIRSLEKMLPLYDDSLMSLYDLCHITCADNLGKRKPSKKYHIIHVKQLYGLNSIAPNSIIKAYADKWRKQATIHRLKK